MILVALALACLSPFRLPALRDLPDLSALRDLPSLLGLVPEPAAVVTSPAPPTFAAVDSGIVTPPLPAQRPGPGAAAPVSPPPPIPRVSGRPAGSVAGAQRPAGAPLPTLPPDEVPRGRYHRVEPGQTAATIARAYGLRSQWAIYDANPVIVRPNRPPVGTWLYIPHPSVLPQPRPRPGQPGYTGQPSNTVIVDGIWLQLAQCESSGNWAIDTGNTFYGGLQFTLDSWRFVGGAGYPHEAHPMEQIARADYLQRIQGWKAWPLCAEKLGLLAPGEGQAQVDRARAAQRKSEAPQNGADGEQTQAP